MKFGAKSPLSVADLMKIGKDSNPQPESTPAARWRTDNEPDPHEGRYDHQRAQLSMGYLTDEELANGAFMGYDAPFDIDAILRKRPGYHPPIVWMTAVKDRIRWLSRRLVEANSVDWSKSDTSPDALWKNPLSSAALNLQIADGAIHERDLTIANLRAQLAELKEDSRIELVPDDSPKWGVWCVDGATKTGSWYGGEHDTEELAQTAAKAAMTNDQFSPVSSTYTVRLMKEEDEEDV